MSLLTLMERDLGRVFLNPNDFAETVTVTPLSGAEAYPVEMLLTSNNEEARLGAQGAGTLAEPVFLATPEVAEALAEGDRIVTALWGSYAVVEVVHGAFEFSRVRVVQR